jgi:hypothetical protein
MGAALAVGVCTSRAGQTPPRPQQVSDAAVWRPTPSDSVPFAPHGDWVSCAGAGMTTHCVLTDAEGKREYEGVFQTVPDRRPITAAELQPITSEAYSPWMWSARENRMVPIIHLEDGTVLTPRESVAELRSYVEKIRRFTTQLRPAPVYAAETKPRAEASRP